MGSIFSSYFAAMILGVPVGSFLGDELGWNAVFGLACINALLLLPVVGLTLPRLAARSVYRGAARLAAGQIRVFAGFLRRQKTAGALLSSFFASAGTMGFIAFVGVWLNESFGVSGKNIGLVFLVSGAAALVVSPFAGALSDKIGKRIQFIFSNLALAALLFLLPGLVWGILLFLVFGAISISAAFRQGPMEALITEVVPAQSRGSFIAMKNASSQLGIALAALVSGLLFSASGYGAVCVLCALCNLCAAGGMLFLVRERHL
jgi:predicted MFS family arabinose efflux permease